MTALARCFEVDKFTADYRHEKAARIRKFMKTTPGIWDCQEERPFLDALMILSHLDPTSAESAMWAHKQVVREARRRLTEWGHVDPWIGEVLFDLCGFIGAHGFAYKAGRFTQIGLDKWIPQ
jgi:hypothetical protein